jgi:membrane glycosyltransferase
MPNLQIVNRYQLVHAIAMFFGSPAWIGLILFCTVGIGFSETPTTLVNIDYLPKLLIVTLVMWYLPKICGALDVLLRTSKSKHFGGRLRFTMNLFFEIVFSILMTPITWFNHTIFIIGLMFGKKAGWSSQTRDDHAISIPQAIHHFWPHTILGLALSFLLYFKHPETLVYGFIFFGGLLFSIPLVVITSQPWLGRLMIRYQLLSLPEEIMPSKELISLELSTFQVNTSKKKTI